MKYICCSFVKGMRKCVKEMLTVEKNHHTSIIFWNVSFIYDVLNPGNNFLHERCLDFDYLVFSPQGTKKAQTRMHHTTRTG